MFSTSELFAGPTFQGRTVAQIQLQSLPEKLAVNVPFRSDSVLHLFQLRAGNAAYSSKGWSSAVLYLLQLRARADRSLSFVAEAEVFFKFGITNGAQLPSGVLQRLIGLSRFLEVGASVDCAEARRSWSAAL